MPKPEIELDYDWSKMPRVNREEVLKHIHKVNFFKTAIFYMINHKVRKQVDVQLWLKYYGSLMPEELKPEVEYMKELPTNLEKVKEVLRFVRKNLVYRPDTEVWGVPEYWQEAAETWKLRWNKTNKNYERSGDCVEENEEIHTKNGLKKAKDIKVGDELLSYDFDKKEYVYKPVVNFWNKGELDIYEVKFRNGQSIKITEDHKMLIKKSQKTNEYEETKLKDIDLSRWWKRKVPTAMKIERTPSKPLFPLELYRVIGHYLAEGWSDKKKYSLYSSGYELDDYIVPILEEHNIPFTYCDYGDVPRIRFLKSDFKEYIKPLKNNSFDISLSKELLTLPDEYLEELLYGLWLGDGTKNQYPDNRGYANNKEWTYSTSSEQLAKDIQLIHLYLGKPIHTWKQENHRGVGHNPIWRLNRNSNSRFAKDFGYNGLSESSIKEINHIGKEKCYDWEVKDTHNFFFKNGICVHNCEDGAVLIYTIAKYLGIPDYQMYLVAGDVDGGGHCYVVYINEENGLEYPIDWCYWYADSINMENPYRYREKYFYGDSEWFRFNVSGNYRLWTSNKGQFKGE